jgi:hypothetical protein
VWDEEKDGCEVCRVELGKGGVEDYGTRVGTSVVRLQLSL